MGNSKQKRNTINRSAETGHMFSKASNLETSPLTEAVQLSTINSWQNIG